MELEGFREYRLSQYSESIRDMMKDNFDNLDIILSSNHIFAGIEETTLLLDPDTIDFIICLYTYDNGWSIAYEALEGIPRLPAIIKDSIYSFTVRYPGKYVLEVLVGEKSGYENLEVT